MSASGRDAFRVPFDGTFRVADAPTSPPKGGPDRTALRDLLAYSVDRLGQLQRKLWAEDRRALLVIFQALDAAGKDSAIRAVFTGVNPAGIRVHSFKQPTVHELDHDFLWRSTLHLPERGQIGVFNRSCYEEVIVVRVHPEILVGQRLPEARGGREFWKERFRSIREHERHLARNGTTIVKFWLHVSADEQRRRLLQRLDNPAKRWKFSIRDVGEREYRDEYLRAYEEALNETSTSHAPWYAVPADDKPFMKATVARILVEVLEGMDPRYPDVGEDGQAEALRIREVLDGGA